MTVSPQQRDHMHKSLCILSATTLATGIGIAMAPSALAAASPSTIYVMPADATVACNVAGNVVTIRDSDARSGGAPTGNIVSAITGVAADSVLIENRCAGGGLSAPNAITVEWVGTSGGVTNGIQSIPQSGSYNLTLGTVSTLTFKDAASLTRSTIGVTSGGGGGGGGGSSSGSASTSAPAPIVQQFGKPVIGTCAAAAPESLNWSGVANGGWGESWAQWINAGSGGAVCSRTLVYSNAQGRWIVG
jgi:hypothetical protein